MPANPNAGTAPRDSKPQNKPLYSDASRGIAVFPDSVTNPNTQKTTEYFVYCEGKGDSAVRIGRIPTRIGGYDLENNQAKGYSDVVDLVDGKELVRHGVGDNNSEYTQIIAPLGVVDVPRANDPSKTDKHLDLYVATAYLRKDAEFDQEGRPNVQSFSIHSKPPVDGKQEGNRDLTCWRFVPIEGSKNPRTNKPRWFEIRVSDALKARDAIARGEAFSFTHGDVQVKCAGIKQPEQKPGEEKHLKPTLQFEAVQVAQRQQPNRNGGRSFGYRGGGTHDGNSVPSPDLIPPPLPESKGAAQPAPAQGRR